MPPHLNLPIALLTILLLALPLLTLRLLSIIPPYRPSPRPRPRGAPTRLLIVLGSGGHTAEIFALLRDLDPCCYTHRSYVVSSGDDFSAGRAREFEAGLAARWGAGHRSAEVDGVGAESKPELEAAVGEEHYDISTIPRARRIHQSLLSTPITALHCLSACFAVLRRRSRPNHSSPSSSSLPPTVNPPRTDYPDLILTNGPGTAVILILASLMLRFFDLWGANTDGKMRTIYVESWARVRRLSLSGRLLVRVVDRLVVQWEGLRGVGGRGEYLGGALV